MSHQEGGDMLMEEYRRRELGPDTETASALSRRARVATMDGVKFSKYRSIFHDGWNGFPGKHLTSWHAARFGKSELQA